jgi:adenine-specific DNA-methyltransferase
MRFIGSKAALLSNIEAVINENTNGDARVFCDIFSGTGAVARYFKPRFEMHSNDLLHFSYVLQKATVENNGVPDFGRLKNIGIADPFRFLEDTPIQAATLSDERFFITKNYAPNERCGRMYISVKNAARVDFIRTTIEAWKQTGLLDENEYYYLLAGLIEGVPFVSNITGTYGAYLKEWDKRAYKNFEMVRLEVVDNRRSNKCYNMDANKLIGELEGDILYLDPPYNSRQYVPNYHLLETISRYDHPQIQGVTGMRPYKNEKSPYCVKGEVLNAFEDLLSKAKFPHIILSYSADGLMTAGQIDQVLKKHGVAASFRKYDIPYRKYKSKIVKGGNLTEYLFYIKKNVKRPRVFDVNPATKRGSKPVSGKKYIKSPLNYIGGKYKLLTQIIPHFPPNIATFVDLFSGGANIAINVTADKIICNDLNSKIIGMFRAFQGIPAVEILSRIEKNIETFGLSKENEEGFLTFREYYNRTKDPVDLYTLTCYSFNYQFRFNNNLEYNNPFGRNRSQFSENMKNNLLAFVDRLKKSDITFSNNDFTEIDLNGLGPQDFIYCDPPYLITTGTYNDGNRGFKDWNKKEELQLYDYLDQAHARQISFALSNVIEHKGIKNELLLEWSKKYKVISLDFDYSNASYNTKKGDSKEVLIVNY